MGNVKSVLDLTSNIFLEEVGQEQNKCKLHLSKVPRYELQHIQ